MRVFIISSCCMLFLSGCVNYNTSLRDSAGNTAHCNAFGFGLIGSAVAMAQHSDCMDKYSAAGYKEE